MGDWGGGVELSESFLLSELGNDDEATAERWSDMFQQKLPSFKCALLGSCFALYAHLHLSQANGVGREIHALPHPVMYTTSGQNSVKYGRFQPNFDSSQPEFGSLWALCQV